MLIARRNDGESWRECVERYGKKYGLDLEALEIFDREVKAGRDEGEAAFEALYEWDLLDFDPEGQKEEPATPELLDELGPKKST